MSPLSAPDQDGTDQQDQAGAIIGKTQHSVACTITGINPEAILMVGDHYGHLLCPGLQPGPPSQTPGGLGQR